MAAHEHHHHDHDHHHDHGHHGHDHHAPPPGWRYAFGMVLNLGFVLVEAGYGFFAHSTALLADAGHNLSDVLGLGLAGGAAWLANRAGGEHRTYGYGKATVLAALANGLVLIFACGAIVREAIDRFGEPQAVAATPVMIVAAVGVAVNLGTALLFTAGRKDDINVRGAFLHMMADAAVSVGVIVAGGLIMLTGKTWIDPLTSLVIVLVIGWSTWGLLRQAVNMAMDAAPEHIDVNAVRDVLLGQPGVSDVHDLHVWNLSTTEAALTAHVVRPQGVDCAFLEAAEHALDHRFGLKHVTLQVEPEPCAGRHALHP